MKQRDNSANRNALAEGLYAKDVLLPWDSQKDFVELHQDLRIEFSPHGRAEDETVLHYAFLCWHRRTLWRLWQTAILKDPFTLDIMQTESKSWSEIRKRLRAAANEERTLWAELEGSQLRTMSQVKRLEKKIETASNKDQIKVLEEKVAACLRMISEHIAPLLRSIMQGPNAEDFFNRVYAPESLEKIMRLDAALDAQIDKVISRLARLKAFKRTPARGAGTRPLEAATDFGDLH